MQIEYDPDMSDAQRNAIESMLGYVVRLELTPDALPLTKPFNAKDVFIVGTTVGPGSVCKDELCITFRLFNAHNGEPFGPIVQVSVHDIERLYIY